MAKSLINSVGIHSCSSFVQSVRSTMDAITPLAKPSYMMTYMTSWTYCNEYFSDCTNKFYVLYTVSYQINLRSIVVADTRDVNESDCNDTDEDGICSCTCRDDSVNNINSVILSGLCLVRYDEQEALSCGFGDSWAVL